MLPLKLKPEIFRPTRRAFLLGAAVAGTGLSVSFRVPGARAEAAAEPNPFNAYVTISPDNKVTILSAHMDMGQGAYHGIATLVAEGRTNREVAVALFLGERTVAGHLTHIYAKLGVRSRTELARRLQ